MTGQIERIGSPPPTPRARTSGASALAGRELGERLDGAKLRKAKNLKDAVIATPSPPPIPGRSSPSQADPDTSLFGSGKGGEGNKHRATHDSGRAGLCARAAPYRWAVTQGKFWSVCAGREGGVRRALGRSGWGLRFCSQSVHTLLAACEAG